MNVAYLIDRKATEWPELPAILPEDGPALDWRGFAERVARLAGAIAAQGVEPGDRIALLAPNGPAFLEITLAAARMGAVIVPLNWRLAPKEIAFQLADADCALLFLDAKFEALVEGIDGLATIAIGGGAPEYDSLIAGAEPLDLAPVTPDDPLGIFYTGGTTGVPKGVVLTHQNLLSNATHVAPRMGYGPSDTHLHAAPMFHLADLGGTFAQLFGGGAHAFQAKFEPAGFFAAVERHRVSTTVLAPTMLAMALRDPAVSRHDLASLRRLNYGGSPITGAVLRQALDVLPCELSQGYGQTEATHTVCILSPEDHVAALDRPELLRSCGKPVEGVLLRIADEDDRPVETGTVGEVQVRAPTVMKGYWRREAETAAALKGGWLHTGDLGARNAAGYVTLVDRKKDMIVTGAENVFSTEVENALASHPAVVEVAVIGVPDETFGERVHAVVVAAAGSAPDEADLQAHARKAIAGYKIPRSVEFVEALPKSAAGKVRKADLRAPYWAQYDRKTN